MNHLHRVAYEEREIIKIQMIIGFLSCFFVDSFQQKRVNKSCINSLLIGYKEHVACMQTSQYDVCFPLLTIKAFR